MNKITLTSNKDIEYSGFRLTKTRLKPIGKPTFKQWEECGKFIKKAEQSIQFWVGDWINYGEKSYGNKYTKALETTDYEQATLHNTSYVARKVEPSLRSEDLTFSHHKEVAPLKPKEQKEFLDKAEKDKLSVSELKVLIKEKRLNSQEDDIDDRKITPYGDNIFYLSSKFQIRPSDFVIIKDGEPYPTLKRRSWFYHEDEREFSLREYAQVQTFPDEFKFVGTYEKIKDQIGNAVAPKMASYVGQSLKGKTIGDLFAGCGGLSYGLKMLGKEVLWAIERNVNSARTYKINHPKTKVLTRDIKKINPSTLEKVDVIVGGPPCQGFSLSGLRFKDDPRNELYKEFLRFVDVLKPKEFIMENVPQIKQLEKQIVKDFNKIGYKVEGKLIRGEDIGMRQKRNRYFYIGKINGNN